MSTWACVLTAVLRIERGPAENSYLCFFFFLVFFFLVLSGGRGRGMDWAEIVKVGRYL